MICKILRLFVNSLTAHDKYSLLKRGNLLQHFQLQLSQKQKILSDLPYLLISERSIQFDKSLLEIYKILGLFVKPLIVGGKYSLPNKDNLLQNFQMDLSQKRKIFSQFFFPFPKFRFNF